MMSKFKKILRKINLMIYKPLSLINPQLYTKKVAKFYRKQGMNIKGEPFYFHSSIHFDGTDYGLITIGEGVSISKNVEFLTHDFSANTVFKGLELSNIKLLREQYEKDRLLSVKPIKVGANTFIGLNVLLCPGSNIGDNCVIGAGTVVRGSIPDNSIAIGNPCRVIKKTSEWLEGKYNCE